MALWTPHSQRRFRFDTFEVDLWTGELRKNGTKLKVQNQPFKVLAMLLARPGELVTREELREGLWSDNTFVDFERGLNTAVNRLRAALNDSAESPRFVETVGSRGYRFICRVGPSCPRSDGKGEDENGRGLPQPSSLTINAARPSRWLGSVKRRSAGLMASILAAVLVYVWLARARHIAPPYVRSLAVLPLESLSSDSSQAYFADGLTDQLITDLGQVSSVRVISRTSIMNYKGTHKPLPQIARELNVDAVVEGTIMRSENRVRITAQLIQTPADRHLWAGSYDGDLSNALYLQERVAHDIANHIQAHLPGQQQQEEEKSPARPIRSEAYDAYLRGRYFEEQHNPGALQKAIDYFKQAIQEDPRYALAYVGLAYSYNELSYRDVAPPGKVTHIAQEAAQKALQLDDNSAEAHTVVAVLEWTSFEWDRTRTERELERAIQLNPSYAPAHDIYAWVLSARGRADAAIGEAKRALELDPLGVETQSHLGDAYYFAHRYSNSIEQHRGVLELYPTASEPNQNLALDYLVNRMSSAFLVQAERWMNVSGEASSRLAAASLHQLKRTDYHQGVTILIQQAIAQRKIAYASSAWIATLYAQNGQTEQALAWLEAAYEERDPNLLYIAVDSAYDGLHTDPRFQRLAAQIQ